MKSQPADLPLIRKMRQEYQRFTWKAATIAHSDGSLVSSLVTHRVHESERGAERIAEQALVWDGLLQCVRPPIELYGGVTKHTMYGVRTG